jgi:hypothetical protein
VAHKHEWGSWSAWEPVEGITRPLEVRYRYCQTCGKQDRQARYR